MPESLVMEPAAVPAPQAEATPPLAPKRRTAHSPLLVGTHPGGLDRASWNRFRAGKLAPTRTLDLHGRTAQNAFHALNAFLHAAHADGVRCVEVITGRGSGEGGGVIRRELPLWLNLPALRPFVLAASHPHAANPGSVRLLLRRSK
jgi:DNA-nicking Smr family endonuclease